MADITFEIKKNIAVLSTSKKGWTKEANMISWNGAAPKLDIRDWAPDHEKMGKGIVLSQEETQALINALIGEEPAPAPQPEEPKPQPKQEEPKPQPKQEAKPSEDPMYAGMTEAMIAQIKAAKAKMGM